MQGYREANNLSSCLTFLRIKNPYFYLKVNKNLKSYFEQTKFNQIAIYLIILNFLLDYLDYFLLEFFI